MTNPILKNKVSTDTAILWQYDKAYNLINLITNWNKFGTVACEYFWNYFGNKVFSIDDADEYGLTVWGNLLGISRPSIKIDDSISNIDDPFYRRILKARFFMMCHSPTVPNYNRYLAILFGAIKDGNKEYDASKIFDAYGNVNEGYSSRCFALDFQDMSMGFSFPTDATEEEAYTIFQHYDVLFPFPAGIRYPGEFIDDELVIGMNLTNGDKPTGQNYKNFVDGLVLAEDISDNANGGIFSTTDHANYKVSPTVSGIAYIVPATNLADSSFNITINNSAGSDTKIWVDWGTGECGYEYIKGGATKSIKPNRNIGANGYVAVTIYHTQATTVVLDSQWYLTTYTL